MRGFTARIGRVWRLYPSIGGMSGGPVVDASGRLVGMTVARGSDGTEHFFLRIEALREWLQSV